MPEPAVQHHTYTYKQAGQAGRQADTPVLAEDGFRNGKSVVRRDVRLHCMHVCGSHASVWVGVHAKKAPRGRYLFAFLFRNSMPLGMKNSICNNTQGGGPETKRRERERERRVRYQLGRYRHVDRT